MDDLIFGRGDCEGLLSRGFDCPVCGAWFWRLPLLAECAACGEELCPNCQPVECACGETFCQSCIVRLRDGDGEYGMCPACLRAAGLCEACGEAPQEIRRPEEGGTEKLLCADCALACAENILPLR